MNNRSKIVTFGLIVLIIFTGVIYAQSQKDVENKADKFEITENRKEENFEDQKIDNSEEYNESEVNSQNNSNLNSKPAAGMINLEELMAVHPKTRKLHNEYITEKEKLQAEENSAENIENLKDNYTTLVIEKTKSDLIKFAEKEDLNLLLVNDKAVFGSKTEYQDLTEVNNQTDSFKKFLNK